jgi:hypothetical protein
VIASANYDIIEKDYERFTAVPGRFGQNIDQSAEAKTSWEVAA